MNFCKKLSFFMHSVMYRLMLLIGRYELWTLYQLWDLFYSLWFTTVFTYYYMKCCNVLICQTWEIIMEANKTNFDASSCYLKMLVQWMKLHFFIWRFDVLSYSCRLFIMNSISHSILLYKGEKKIGFQAFHLLHFDHKSY